MTGLYFLAVLFPQKVEEEIRSFKQDFADHFGAYAALKPPGHITMAETFKTDHHTIQQYIPRLKSLFASFSAFECQIRIFGTFPKHTIFAAIENPRPFKKIRQELYLQRKHSNLLDRWAIPSQHIHPHVTVAYRDLSQENYDAGWAKYSQLQFSAEFKIDHVHLLQHKTRWKSIFEFPLLGTRGKRAEQLSLFPE